MSAMIKCDKCGAVAYADSRKKMSEMRLVLESESSAYHESAV